MRPYRTDPAATIARSIPRDIGSRERQMSDLSRTVVVRLATEDYRVTEALFAAVRTALESQP